MKKNSIPKLELVFLLLLTGMCPQAHATDDGRNASPQKTYAVDLTLGSATVLTFTEAVTSQTGVLFSYESALSQMPLGDVSVHETAAPLEHILEKVFKGRGFRYKVVDRIVVLTYDTDSARSQLVLVTGRVKDGSGMPLVGASVVVKDTMRGVSAGAEGNYRIFADPEATLVFSYIGYADREERIGTRSAIDVVLEEYEAVLEDVVVVGYGTQSRRTVTAAISKFDGHLLEGIPVNSVGDALKGRIPGVRVATTDATPGADPKFLIRGGSSINQSNDPIVLVDGVVREMAGLNPNDIESVSFLKDAAAAGIYGSRASNGVILITTKKGSKHLGPRIVFEGQWAWASPATKFDLMNARDYILTVRPALMEGYCGGMDPASVLGGEQSAGTGNTAKSLWTTRYLRPDEQVPAGYQWVEDPVNPGRIIVFEDNDQQSQWFGDACWQNYYVGIDGGGDNIQYAASAGYTDDSGIGITTGYSRFTFHGNTTFQVTRRLRASTTFDYSQIEQQTFESAPLSLRNSVIRGLSVPNTHRDWYGEEAGEELAGTPALGTNNTTIPAAYYAYYYHNAGSTIKRSTATINLDWEVFDGLRLVGQFTNYNRHTRSYFYVEDNPTTGSNIRPMKEGFSETNRMDFQAYADYKGTFGNGHRLGAVAGYEYMLDKLNSFDVRVQGAVSDKLPVLDAGTSNIANYPKSTRTRECLISYFGRVNYDYGGRYLLAATMRIDGSSKFAAGHRWGYFPAASTGWVVSKEGFWPENSAVSMLKARVSYGLTGNNGIGLYDTYGSYNSLYTYNGNATTTTNTMPNNGLIWEKTLQFNAGIDLGLLDNRITLALDYYNKETRDLLFDVSLPNTTGYNSVSTNLGRVRFYGTELSLSSVNIDRKGFSWRTDFTYSYNMNRVLELPDNGNPRNRINGISVGDGSQFGGIAEGERMGRIFGYVAERIIETQEEADAARGKSGNIAGRPGYVKMGAGSAAASLYTPELTALPDAATVKVRFSAQAYSEKYDGSGADAGKILVKAVRGAVLGAKGAITGTVTEVSAADPVDISAAKARFREFEATLTNVTPDCRIVISTSEKRALLDNVVVTCTAITPATKPAAPGGVSFDAAAAADRLTLKWNAVPDATSYTVAYWKGSASAPESEYAYKTGIASTATSQELTNLESNTSYWAKVKAVGSLDSDWSETANATTMDSGGEPLLPTADLLDVVFRNDGSAMDNSPSATPVRALEGTAMMTYYNDLYSRYAAHFNHTPGTSVNEGFYKADYSANKQFQDALADGHTLEALFKLDEKSDGSAELKMFSSMSSGGTGFLISKADRGTELTFLPNVSTTGKSSWVWTKSGINPEAGRYYHVVGVWNKQEAKTYIYVDGELKGTMDAPGNYVPPTTTTSYWFGIGVDASATVGQNAWKGDVAIARVYDAPLTAEKVKALWETVKRDQQPAAINITGLLYLSGCEVGADYTYTLYGKGFAAGDRIRFEPLAGSAGAFTLDGSAAAESLSVRIPNGFASGRYRMVLMRGQNQYPLGITQLTYSNNPARVAKPRVIAHRGYHKDGAAQNSVAALAKAQELGIYGSEFDVWITADGKVVINHDSTVPGSSLVIENVNYDQIKDLTLANGEKLPTLDDYLEQATKNADTKLILEIKRHSSAANNARAADAVIEAVKAKGLTDRVEYIAFDYTTCKRIVNALPGAMVQYLNGDLAPAAVRQDGIGGIDYRFSAYSGNPGWVKEAHANGMVTNVWTVDTVQDMMTCIAWGMDFITTNNPETLKELLTRTFVSAN